MLARAERPAAETRPGLPLSRAAAAFTVVYMVVTACAWYWLRKRDVVDANASVVAVYTTGVALFYVVLCRTQRLSLRALGREALVVTGATLAWFTLFWFQGRRSSYTDLFGPVPWGGLRGLVPFFYMVGASVVARMLLPMLTARTAIGRGPLDYGYRLRGTFKMWWVYVGLVAVIVPVVIWASSLASFQAKYPWCKQGIEAGNALNLGVYAIYAATLFVFYASGEAFWRGFLLFGTERRLGDNALFLTLIPYVAGHFGKPLPETLGAIASGLVLGFLALRHRSFWLGALTHWGVAMTMDLAALWRKGVHFVGP
jgi:membrane protease YdiL (CAAX protease family)